MRSSASWGTAAWVSSSWRTTESWDATRCSRSSDPEIIESPGVFDRFLREIRAVARLQHPNIVTAHSAFRCGESLVFAMEYVEGLDLARMVMAKGPVPVTARLLFRASGGAGLAARATRPEWSTATSSPAT